MAFAQQGATVRGAAPVLRGNEFDLVIAESPVNFTGKPGMATTINGSLPGPTLRWREGETVTIRHEQATGGNFYPLARHYLALSDGRGPWH